MKFCFNNDKHKKPPNEKNTITHDCVNLQIDKPMHRYSSVYSQYSTNSGFCSTCRKQLHKEECTYMYVLHSISHQTKSGSYIAIYKAKCLETETPTVEKQDDIILSIILCNLLSQTCEPLHLKGFFSPPKN